jgi:hypothetical protein
LSSYFSFCQTDTSRIEQNKKINKAPKKAALYSALLPGLGQAYNKRYWKIPVIYAAAGGLTYLLIINQKEFKSYSDALKLRYDSNPNTIDQFTQYSDDNLVTLKKQYRRWRDLSALGIAAVYLINIVDANVDAHLKGFEKNINESISMNIQPYQHLSLQNDKQLYNGITVKIKFRK